MLPFPGAKLEQDGYTMARELYLHAPDTIRDRNLACICPLPPYQLDNESASTTHWLALDFIARDAPLVAVLEVHLAVMELLRQTELGIGREAQAACRADKQCVAMDGIRAVVVAHQAELHLVQCVGIGESLDKFCAIPSNQLEMCGSMAYNNYVQ